MLHVETLYIHANPKSNGILTLSFTKEFVLRIFLVGRAKQARTVKRARRRRSPASFVKRGDELILNFSFIFRSCSTRENEENRRDTLMGGFVPSEIR